MSRMLIRDEGLLCGMFSPAPSLYHMLLFGNEYTLYGQKYWDRSEERRVGKEC